MIHGDLNTLLAKRGGGVGGWLAGWLQGLRVGGLVDGWVGAGKGVDWRMGGRVGWQLGDSVASLEVTSKFSAPIRLCSALAQSKLYSLNGVGQRIAILCAFWLRFIFTPVQLCPHEMN